MRTAIDIVRRLVEWLLPRDLTQDARERSRAYLFVGTILTYLAALLITLTIFFVAVEAPNRAMLLVRLGALASVSIGITSVLALFRVFPVGRIRTDWWSRPGTKTASSHRPSRVRVHLPTYNDWHRHPRIHCDWFVTWGRRGEICPRVRIHATTPRVGGEEIGSLRAITCAGAGTSSYLVAANPPATRDSWSFRSLRNPPGPFAVVALRRAREVPFRRKATTLLDCRCPPSAHPA